MFSQLCRDEFSKRMCAPLMHCSAAPLPADSDEDSMDLHSSRGKCSKQVSCVGGKGVLSK